MYSSSYLTLWLIVFFYVHVSCLRQLCDVIQVCVQQIKEYSINLFSSVQVSVNQIDYSRSLDALVKIVSKETV